LEANIENLENEIYEKKEENNSIKNYNLSNIVDNQEIELILNVKFYKKKRIFFKFKLI
jgi:hypothetical protein